MIFDTAECQTVFRTRFTGASGEPFVDFGNGKRIKDELIDNNDLPLYALAIKNDTINYYYKALLSYAEGIDAIERNNLTWATIKLYYSLYFSLRCSLLCRNVVIVRAGRYLYYFNLKNDNCYKRTKESNDHSGTLEVYLNLLSSSDPLCKGTIEGEMPYKWVNSCREIVNYKDGVFHDPEITDLWFTICNYLNKNEMKVLLKKYREKPQETCFSVDDAILSIPTNRMFVIADDLKRDRISALSQIQIEWISSIINNKLYKEDLDYLLF